MSNDKLQHYALEFMEEITQLIRSKPQEQEMFCGAISAMSDAMVMIATRLMNQERAIEIVSVAIAGSFRIAYEIQKENNRE